MEKNENELIRIFLFDGDVSKVDEQCEFLDLDDSELIKIREALHIESDKISEILIAREDESD